MQAVKTVLFLSQVSSVTSLTLPFLTILRPFDLSAVLVIPSVQTSVLLATAIPLLSPFELYSHFLVCTFPSVHFILSTCGFRVTSSSTSPIPYTTSLLTAHKQMQPHIPLSTVQTLSSCWILERKKIK